MLNGVGNLYVGKNISDASVHLNLFLLQIKPVRESMTEALQLWKKIAGKGEDEDPDDQKASSRGRHVYTYIFIFIHMNVYMYKHIYYIYKCVFYVLYNLIHEIYCFVSIM